MKSILYPAPGIAVGEPPTGYEETAVVTPAGETIVLWHQRQGTDKPLLVYFHGNGENLETLKYFDLYGRLSAFATPVVVEYPGYGRSGGTPSEANLKRAAETALTWARETYPGREVVAAGWSLGAAVAVHLAAARPDEVDGLIVLSAWSRLADVAAIHFPRWMVALGLSERYDSLSAATGVACPTLVVHGGRDSIIPVDQGHRLAEVIAGSRWLVVEGASHNDLLGFEAVWRQVKEFLAPLGSP